MLVAVSSLPRDLKSMTLGSILFDRTMNVQNQGAIESYPTEHVQIYCVKCDGVCWGKEGITLWHLAYTRNGDVNGAGNFLIEKINNALSKSISFIDKRAFISMDVCIVTDEMRIPAQQLTNWISTKKE
jgi:hypothetical protein